MKGITFGPAGGRSMSRMQGTKVTLAGRTAFLPNDDVPFVMQKLTMGQINAIPKDRFSVALIEVPTRMGMAGTGRGGKGIKPPRLSYRAKDILRTGGGATGFVRAPSVTVKVDDDGTKLHNTLISIAKQITEKTLVLSRNQRTDPPEQDSGLFYSPIDDGSMTDCIKKAIAHFFGEKETCKIVGKEYKPVAFCLLMHDYFIRMHIMKNTTRTPFCEYLLKHVLKEEMQFTSRTFTKYAQDHKDAIQDFTDSGKLKINFNVHAEPSGKPLQDAFHEIGYC